MLYDLSMSESNKYENMKNNFVSTVYVIQEIAGTRSGASKNKYYGCITTMDSLNFCYQSFLK